RATARNGCCLLRGRQGRPSRSRDNEAQSVIRPAGLLYWNPPASARVAFRYQNPNRRTVDMTYHDPKLPDPGLGRNPPRYRTTNSFGMESILVLTVLAAVIGAILFYPSGDTSGTTASNPPPTTTAQGGTP